MVLLGVFFKCGTVSKRYDMETILTPTVYTRMYILYTRLYISYIYIHVCMYMYVYGLYYAQINFPPPSTPTECIVADRSGIWYDSTESKIAVF